MLKPAKKIQIIVAFAQQNIVMHSACSSILVWTLTGSSSQGTEFRPSSNAFEKEEESNAG